MSLSEIKSELEAMTVPEKLRLMESLWTDLSRHEENLKSPAWHEQLLRDREARVKSGEERFMDWEAAKQQLRDRFK
ncbi:MAG: addiction module protein [Verrucomicrobia bacterium]|nr:addiction module protein [Verrucomicrobiota bacterium]